MIIKTRLVLLCWHLSVLVAYGQFSDKWGDQEDGTYRNPVLPGDFSDLDAIRVGNDYYAISSTMQFSPGMAVLHSKDLVNWEMIGHVADDLNSISPTLNWDRMDRYGRGIWAGSIRYYNNRFWVYFGTPDEGFFMSSASQPSGPWEPLHQVWKVKGWDDCCSFRDDDGQLYFVATNFDLDSKNNKRYNIHLFRMSPDGKKLIMESDTIIHQSKGSEANKLYKINGFYYHYFSEVNNDGGRQIMMRRSKNLYGLWETKQLNKVDPSKDREPNQGGMLQVRPDKWYFFTHHGHGDWEGRPASLLPVTWLDGWPIIGKVDTDQIGTMVWSAPKPITVKGDRLRMQTDDEFDSARLLPQWEWNYQPRADKWSLTERKGFLRLHAFRPINPQERTKTILRAGNTITQRSMRTKSNVSTVKIDVSGMVDGQHAGLTHFSTVSHSALGVKQHDGQRHITYSLNDTDSTGSVVNGKFVWLQSTWNFDGINQYAYSTDGKNFIPIGAKMQLVWGSYRGDRLGIFNFNTKEDKGFIDVDYLHYQYEPQ